MAIQINKTVTIKQQYSACWYNYATVQFQKVP